jgi:hypothetical protein
VVIQDQVKDAAQLIDQILDYGRQTIMQREAIDAVTLIQDTVNLLKRTLPSNIAIKFIQEPGSYILIADKTRLQQVLMNLAVNARDAMPNGGVLQFILSAHKPAAIAWESEVTPSRVSTNRPPLQYCSDKEEPMQNWHESDWFKAWLELARKEDSKGG